MAHPLPTLHAQAAHLQPQAPLQAVQGLLEGSASLDVADLLLCFSPAAESSRRTWSWRFCATPIKSPVSFHRGKLAGSLDLPFGTARKQPCSVWAERSVEMDGLGWQLSLYTPAGRSASAGRMHRLAYCSPVGTGHAGQRLGRFSH